MKSELIVNNIEKKIGKVFIYLGIAISIVWGSWYFRFYVIPPLLEATVFKVLNDLSDVTTSFAMTILGLEILNIGIMILILFELKRRRSKV